MPDAFQETALQQVLAKLLPASACCSVSTTLPTAARLASAEVEFTRNMVAKRKAEFAQGRHCARLAMAQLSPAGASMAIAVGQNREPLWPAGIIGSITHARGIAAAAIARQTDLRGIGIDIESSEPLEADIAALVRRTDESEWDTATDAKILFSIKESVYKCIYPLLGRFVDFTEMRVMRCDDPGAYLAEPQFDSNQLLPARLNGRFYKHGSLVLSTAWIEPGMSQSYD